MPNAMKEEVSQESSTATTHHGKLRGNVEQGVHVFRGVPYGASTSGENRFRPPQSVEPWAGVRDATAIGERCPQVDRRHPEPFTSWYWSNEATGEDCLVLNVFTPSLDRNAKLPVMVYIHGGGYATGSSAVKATQGQNLASKGDVVVVTINHRLNLFGFTFFGEMDGGRYADAGNAGLLDIVAALKWVKENIEQFGGNPNCVTTFGHSGGGSKTALLMTLPAAKGLFHRAIDMAGGSGFSIMGAEEGRASAEAFIAALGMKPNSLASLCDYTPAQLLAARAIAIGKTRRDAFRPVIDGRTILYQASDVRALAVSADVPFILGTADTEATFHLAGDLRNFSLTSEQVYERIRGQLNLTEEKARELVDAYSKNVPGRTPSDVLIAIATDYLYRIPMIRAAERKAAVGAAPAYMYEVGWHSPASGGLYKAPHTMQVPLVFGNYEIAAPLLGSGHEPKVISDAMLKAFTSFARSGDPNHAGIPEWEPFSAANHETMIFNLPCRQASDYKGADFRVAGRFPLDESLVGRSIYTYKE